MNDEKPAVKSGNHPDHEHLPTEQEFMQLLKRDQDLESGQTVANYSVYHKYSRGT
ncbi:MAG: hypothetical protein Q8O14_12970 [bacterium]|nr:hypothetical protein [bacterium]